jgi:hypothetical protein
MTITFGINARVLGFAMLLARLFLTHCGARMDGFYKYVFVTCSSWRDGLRDALDAERRRRSKEWFSVSVICHVQSWRD